MRAKRAEDREFQRVKDLTGILLEQPVRSLVSIGRQL
jgi:hypothetical protein